MTTAKKENPSKPIIVDVVAPGFDFNPEVLTDAKAILKDSGIQLRIPPGLRKKDLLFAAPDEIRFKHLDRALKASDSDFIWCVRGGSGTYRLLPKLDKNLSKYKPKTIIGYSDITSLLNYFYMKKKWVSIHGPLLENLVSPGRSADVAKVISYILNQPGKLEKGFSVSPVNEKAKNKKRLSGIALGGNLSVLGSHMGTPYALKAKSDSILVLEDVGERAYKVDKLLFQLEASGSLKNIKAIVFGEFLGGKEKSGLSLVDKYIKRYSSSSKIPIYKTKAFGHGVNKSPLLIGHKTVIENGTLRFIS